MSRWKQAVMWWVIAVLMILVVRTVLAQAFQAVPSNQCSPAMVFWHTDSLSVVSTGCVDFRKDSLIIIPHIVNGIGRDALIVRKPAVDSVILLRPAQTAVMRPPNRG